MKPVRASRPAVSMATINGVPEHVAIILAFGHIGLAQRPHAIAQHRPRSGVHQAQRPVLRDVLGGRDARAPVIEEEVRPRLKAIGVDRIPIARIEICPATCSGIRHNCMCRRYSFQKPRTAASLTRLSSDAVPLPPISTSDAASAAPATPR
jgi:hypothetical protein